MASADDDQATRAFLLRGHFSDSRSLGPEDLAAMRPASPPRRRTRARAAPIAAPAVTRASEAVFAGVVCFCGERYGPDQAAEFMVHLRAEVGDDLRELARIREWRRKTASKPEYRERQAERRRERLTTDPQYREKRNAAQRERRQRPEVRGTEARVPADP